MSLGLGLGLMLGQNVAATGGGGGTAVTWDTVNSDASWGTYTNGNLTAVHGTTSDGTIIASGGGKASGTFSVTLTTFNGFGAVIGVRTPGAPVNTFLTNVGAGNHAVAYNAQTGQIFVAGIGGPATVAAAVQGDQITVVYSSSSVEFKKNGTSIYTYSVSADIPPIAVPAASSNQNGNQFTLDPTGW